MTSLADDFLTLRDLLRYAVSRFRKANLTFEQGTTTALDEAAFLLLWGLDLPIDQLEPYLDARLTRPEREKLLGLIETRVTTRKPAAYITGEAWIKGFRFIVDERVIVPRSYVGELLATDVSMIDNGSVRTVLDLCTGSGCLAILAAHAFPHAKVDAAELSADALAVAKLNVADYEIEDQVTLHQGDLFAPLKGKRYDLIVSNPPYIRDEVIERYPDEHRSEPRVAHSGGSDGLVIVRRIIDEAREHLEPEGRLLMEVGRGREALERAYPDIPFLWLDTEDAWGEMFLVNAAELPGGRAKKRK